MKYLFLLLLLTGCCDNIDVEKARRDAVEVTQLRAKLDKNKYLNACYKHWTGDIVTWKESTFVQGDTGLDLCTYNKVCDYKNSKKCITHLMCSNWSRYDHIEDAIREKRLKVTECPK